MSNIALRCAIAFVVISLAACGRNQGDVALSEDDAALKEFKVSSEGIHIAKCAGVTGSIKWEIFSSTRQSNPSVRVVEADVTKPQGKDNNDYLKVQWLYNLDTKVFELSYVGKDGKSGTIFDMVKFCLKP